MTPNPARWPITGHVVTMAIRSVAKVWWLRWRPFMGDLGERTVLAATVKIKKPRRVHIGDDVVLNDFVHIWGNGGVRIGDATIVAAHVVITSQSHAVDALSRGLRYRDTVDDQPVSIGKNVWVGSHVTILPGVAVGDDAIIAAGAVVTRDVPARSLVMGVPATVVRQL